jgi:chromosome segregation ATPase
MWGTAAAWAPLLATLASILSVLYVFVTVRQSAGAQWEKVAKSLEARVKALEGDLGDSRQEVYDLTRKVQWWEKQCERLSLRNLDIVAEADRLVRRVQQLEAAMRRAGIPVPPEEEE